MSDSKFFQLDSEVAVLSIILRNPDLAHSATGLRPHMFSSVPHQILFQEIEEAVEKRLSPDPALLIASLDSKNAIDKVGGKKYIEVLMGRDYSEKAFEEFSKLVLDSYRARSYLSIISTAKKEDLTSATIDEYIYSTKKALENLMEVGGSVETVHVGDVTKSTFDEIVSRTKNPGIRGSSWGVPEIDRATGGKNGGDLWVIGGRPGAGKTALVCNSILADGLNGVPALLIEREMRTQELMERLISIDTGVPNTNLRLGVLTQEQIDLVYNSLNKLKKLPIYIDTNYRASDPYYIEATVNKFRNQHGIEVVYLDYIQLLAERDETQTQEIGRLSRLFKIMANELNICSILLSQLNRNVESRDNKRPLLSDMRQSGALEEDADFAIGLYRDEYYNKETKYKNMMEYIILKHRNGPAGTISLKFDGPSNKISEAK